MSDPDQLHADLRALIGATLHDRYHVEALLGVGGMGAVFKARHTGLERDVAIKVLHPEIGRDESVSKRFVREATSASRLDHPNCVRVTDFGTTDEGTKYLVMELLAGTELEERLGRPWAPDEMIAVARQILEGLEHAHHFGIVHRDLKPENVFLTTDYRGEELVKLVDFGIAKLLDDQGAEKLTRAGIVFGTPRYMSPEQAAGGKIDARTDLYAVGLIFYQMLAGQPPFDADEPAQLLRMQIMAPPPPLPDTVPPALARVVERLLEKSKMDRYSSAREVLDALDEVASTLGAPADAALAGAGAALADGATQPAPTVAIPPRGSTLPTSALEVSNDLAETSLAETSAARDGRSARSGASWQPASASASGPVAGPDDPPPKSTQLYSPGLPPVGATGSHASVGQPATGPFDSLASSPAAGPGQMGWTGSHPPVPTNATVPPAYAAPASASGDGEPKRWVPVALAAGVALLGLVILGAIFSSCEGGDGSSTSDESSAPIDAKAKSPDSSAASETDGGPDGAPSSDGARDGSAKTEGARAAPTRRPSAPKPSKDSSTADAVTDPPARDELAPPPSDGDGDTPVESESWIPGSEGKKGGKKGKPDKEDKEDKKSKGKDKKKGKDG